MEPQKILVVDDSRVILKIYGVLLRQFALVYADNGVEALDCLNTQPDIDLILLDINMPQMNGISFLKEVKGGGPFQEIPVIVVSVEDKEEDKRRCLEAGAAAYIEKPLNTKKLLELIDSL